MSGVDIINKKQSDFHPLKMCTSTIVGVVISSDDTMLLQVDKVIGEAVNPDNLCELYEGWTPWV